MFWFLTWHAPLHTRFCAARYDCSLHSKGSQTYSGAVIDSRSGLTGLIVVLGLRLLRYVCVWRHKPITWSDATGIVYGNVESRSFELWALRSRRLLDGSFGSQGPPTYGDEGKKIGIIARGQVEICMYAANAEEGEEDCEKHVGRVLQCSR